MCSACFKNDNCQHGPNGLYATPIGLPNLIILTQQVAACFARILIRQEAKELHTANRRNRQ